MKFAAGRIRPTGGDETRGGPWLAGLRSAAFFALLIGAIGSIMLWVHAAEHPPLLIITLFVIWVLSPFVVLGIAHVKAKGWAPGTQTALYSVTLFVALASLVVYGDDALGHRTAHPAFVYVAVPPVAWVLTGVAVAIGALIARKRSQT
jgi:hypothetical protein